MDTTTRERETVTPPAKEKTEQAKDAPTEAQLATISALEADLGTTFPEPATAAEAEAMIESMRAQAEEQEPEPEPSADDEAEEAEAEEQAAAEEAQARSGAERSDKQTQQMFDRAVNKFRETLCVVFEVDDLQPAGTPGVIGFLLPGFTEQKTHEDFTRCLTCNGYGTVLTGSSKAGEETRPCPDARCKGRGYWERAHAAPPAPQIVATPALTGPTVYDAQPNGGGEYAEAPAWMGDPRLSVGQTP